MHPSEPHAPAAQAPARLAGVCAGTRAARVVVVGEDAGTLQRAWSSGIGRFWPGRAPVVSCLSHTDVTSRSDAASALLQADAVLLYAAGEAGAPAAAWRCQEAGARGLIVVDPHDGALVRRLTAGGGGDWPDGFSPVTPDIDVRVLAGMLAGVAQEARALRSLEDQLAAASRAQAHADRWLRSVDDELHLAARLQQEIMPRALPDVQGLELGALYRPLWHVSGDIYRAMRLDDRHVGVVLADAMGHGVAAAMYTMLIACGLVTKEVVGQSHRVVPPAEALARLNIELIGQQHESEEQAVRFASAVYVVIDVQTRLVRGACAGHAGPLRVCAGRWTEATGDGPVMGVFADATFDEFSFVMEPGETIVLYSDGVEQAFLDEAFALGASRQRCGGRHVAAHRELMASALELMPGRSLAEAMALLGDGLHARAGSLHRTDDLTVVGLRLNS